MAGFAEVGAMPFHPFVDGEVIAVPAGRRAGDQRRRPADRDDPRRDADVPRSGGRRPRSRPARPADGPIPRVARRPGGRGAASLVASYDGDPHLPTPGDVWSAIQTDGEMRRPCDAMADAHHRSGGATFAYRFDEPLAGRAGAPRCLPRVRPAVPVRDGGPRRLGRRARARRRRRCRTRCRRRGWRSPATAIRRATSSARGPPTTPIAGPRCCSRRGSRGGRRSRRRPPARGGPSSPRSAPTCTS